MISPHLFLALCLAIAATSVLYAALGRTRTALVIAAIIGIGMAGMAYPLLSHGVSVEEPAPKTVTLPPQRAADAVERARIAAAWTTYRYPECHETPETVLYNAAPIRPIRTQRGDLVDGAWFERTTLLACGHVLQISGTGYVNGRGEILHRAALPGVTYLPPRNQEGLLDLIGASRWDDAAGKPCANVVIDTEQDLGQPYRGDAAAWKEIWHFRTCAGEIARTITFARPSPNQISPTMVPLPGARQDPSVQTPSNP